MNILNTRSEYLGILLFLAAAIFCLVFSFTDKTDDAPAYDPVSMYNSSGLIPQHIKIWVGEVVPTVATSQTVNISSAAFTTILSVNVTAQDSTTTITSVPFVSISSITTSQLTLNVATPNSSLISLLGVNVVGLQFPSSTTGMKLNIEVIGY